MGSTSVILGTEPRKTIKSILALSCLVIIVCGPLTPYAGDDDGFSDLRQTLSGLVAKKPGNSVVGVTVVDVLSGVTIYSHNGDQQLNPASNTKIVTAAAAIKLLGPEYRFTTELYGKVEGRSVHGPIYIKGHADPSLSSADLWEMVFELKADGVRRIGGGIVVDDTFFDEENMPYAFNEQPDEDNKFRTPVGAVSLNHNALGIQIRPGHVAMSKARVTMDPPDYAVVVNDSLTTGTGAYSPKISASKFEDRTKVRVWGQVPLGSRPTRYFRRIDNPSLFTGYGLKGVLKESGISVGGDVRVGTIPVGTPLLARNTSEPLSSVLWHTGKMSNNFVTEMVLKTIGANSVEGPATWDASTGAVADLLEKWGVEKGTYQYRNGSGLFGANKFSSSQFCKVLTAAYMDSTVRPEFLAQLATGGVDGTIQSRYKGEEAKRYVRAKTGTLDSVSALSGFVLDKSGRRPIAFSILVNRASGYVAAARKYQEDIATAIARYLNR